MANTKITSKVIADANILTAAIADNAVTGDKVADDVALAGNPTTTTQTAGNSTTRVATTAFVSTAISNLVDSSPAALNTLNELAAALGDDANFSTTVTNSIATKVALSGSGQTIADSGDFTLDVAGDIILDADGRQVFFKDGGTTVGTITMTDSNFKLLSDVSDKDMIFAGTDGGSEVVALTLDMSNAGRATFNENVTVGGNLAVDGADFTITANVKHAGDTDTFFGFNAADTFRIVTGGSEALRVDSSQRVGIGTSPAEKFHVAGNAQVKPSTGTDAVWTRAVNDSGNFHLGIDNSAGSGFTGTAYARFLYSNGAYPLGIFTNGSERMRIDSSGNVGIGTTSFDQTFTVKGGSELQATNSTNGWIMYTYTDNTFRLNYNGAGADEVTIDSAGNFNIGKTSSSITSETGFISVNNASDNHYIATTHNSSGATSHTNMHLYNLNASYNGFRFYVTNNGGIYNYSGNNSNLSDERSKKNITLAENYLDKICDIPVKRFNYKDEPEGTETNLGLIAQDVEKVAPELINTDGFGETPEDGVPLKSIYTDDMMYALMKAIQEQQTIIEDLKSRIETLEE